MKKILVGLTILGLLVFGAGPALAFGWSGWGSSSDIEVENDNNACVSNKVITIAKTGDNSASDGDGGDGGDATGHLWFGGGEGGNGGDGEGGMIITGNAGAEATVLTIANTNKTSIRTPCFGCRGDIEVENDDNDARIKNKVVTVADTGDNEASGGNGGEGGDASKGDGGNGGDGMGGYIETGNAWSSARVINIVNTNITRIRR